MASTKVARASCGKSVVQWDYGEDVGAMSKSSMNTWAVNTHYYMFPTAWQAPRLPLLHFPFLLCSYLSLMHDAKQATLNLSLVPRCNK